MTGKLLQDNINTLDSRFSMRMFISDLPRVLNETFSVIKNALVFYKPQNDEIKVTNINVGTLQASTVITNNIAFKDTSTNKSINFNELEHIKEQYETVIPSLIDKIDKLKTEIENIKKQTEIK